MLQNLCLLYFKKTILSLESLNHRKTFNAQWETFRLALSVS